MATAKMIRGATRAASRKAFGNYAKASGRAQGKNAPKFGNTTARKAARQLMTSGANSSRDDSK